MSPHLRYTVLGEAKPTVVKPNKKAARQGTAGAKAKAKKKDQVFAYKLRKSLAIDRVGIDDLLEGYTSNDAG